jgi:broad specificity phosphatase PhoE
MNLTLIRHGEMTGDPFIRPGRPVRGCLTEERGIPQAMATRDALAHCRFDCVLCSSYGRALQTAEIVFGGRGIPIRPLDFLREWDPTEEVKALPNDEFEKRMASLGSLHVEETWKTDVGEGKLDLYARIVPAFLKELASLGIHARHGGYVPDPGTENLSVAIVAHGGSLNILMEFLLCRSLIPSGGFSFVETGAAFVAFSERRGVYHPHLVIPALHGLSEEPWT